MMKYKTLKELCLITKGTIGITKAIPGKYPLVVTSEERKSHNTFQFDTKAVIIPMVSSSGHGHASLKRIHYQEGKFALGSILCALIPKDENIISSEFLYHYLNVNKERELVSRMKGMANVTLSISEIEKIKVPLLSLKKQTEILLRLKTTDFITKKLNREFEKQFDLIRKLRQQILKNTIQKYPIDKDTSNDAKYELLHKIKEETKIKKKKKSPQIIEEELPDTYFRSSGFIRLGELCNIQKGKIGIKKAKDGLYPLVVTSKERLLHNEIHFSGPSVIVPLVSSTGHGHASLKRIHYQEGDFAVGNILACIQTYYPEFINMKFLYHYLDIYKDHFFVKKMKGAANVSLKISSIEEAIIPIIPIEIQNQFEELMYFLDSLEESICQNQGIAEKIYQSVLKEALQPKKTKKITLHSNYCDVPKRTILAGYILNQCHTEDFGRVKFMKLLYLVEHICYLDFNSQYIKKAAGPYDENLIREIEQKLSQMQFYQIQQNKKDNKRVHYKRLGCADELDSLFATYFANEKQAVDELLTKFKNSTWDQCEIIATLYAVWNNRIIQNELINHALLKQDFLDWDKNKVKYKDRLDAALDWMRNNGIVPSGYGKLIEKP